MTDSNIPTPVRRAAKRAAVRTAAQTLGVAVPTSAVTGAALSGADPVVIAWSIGAAVLSAGLAAAGAALDIVARGIPEDYVDTTVGQGLRGT